MPMPVFHYFLTGFAAASVLLNFAIILGILRHRKSNPILRGSYFGLIIFHGTADILLALETALLMRGRKYRYLDFVLWEGNGLWYVLPWVTNGLNYYLKAVIYVGHILLSFNRFTSIFYSLKYETFWDSKLMNWVCVLAWIVPSFFYLPIVLNFNNEMWYSMGKRNETVRLLMDDGTTQLISYIDGGLSFGATVICLIFYILSAVKISRQMIKHKMHKNQSMEIRLFISSLIQFSLLSLVTANQVWTIVASSQGKNDTVLWLYDLSYPVLDMLYSANPWILCLTSSATRDAIRRLLLPLRNRVASVQVASSAFASSTASMMPQRPPPS
uniref:G_PROTEIN_RECEP_F1_2 domain-containing protein n=1 Tax=Steinernema glaseri TaxID=37863 RepID=A0A1I7ZEP2_9BILA